MEKPDPTSPAGDRIAKVLSRSGVSSRREAERMIEDGRIKVNGERIFSPALNVTPKDRITVDGAPLAAPEPARLWLYHKPSGLVTSASDEKGRKTVFDALPEDMPRVMSIGRLDLTSEGLLLLTNDGELKRKLELPSTGWLRRYRVRINGSVSEDKLDRLRQGISVDGVDYQPMVVTFDRQQGANAWLTISIREGKNREIRRAMSALDVVVNRLIRVSYGPFQIGNLPEGQVEEVRPKVLRDQLGEADAPKVQRRRPDGKPAAKPGFKGGIGKGGKTGGRAGDDARPRRFDKPGGKPFAGTSGGKSHGSTRGAADTQDSKSGRPTGGRSFGARVPASAGHGVKARPDGGGSDRRGPQGGAGRGAASGRKGPKPQKS